MGEGEGGSFGGPWFPQGSHGNFGLNPRTQQKSRRDRSARGAGAETHYQVPHPLGT